MPNASGQEAMNLYDTNKDGKISGAEFDKVPSLLAVPADYQFNQGKGRYSR